jgi:hypothetical protein
MNPPIAGSGPPSLSYGGAEMIPKADHIPRVEVTTEQELPGGWSYQVLIHRNGHPDSHTVTLSWRDHDYWCGGASAPSRLMQALIEFALKHETPPMPAKFDAARIRRWLPQIDQELRGVL